MKYIKLVINKVDSKEATNRINANNFLKSNIDCGGIKSSPSEYKPLRFGGNNKIEESLSNSSIEYDNSGKYKAIELGGGKQIRVYDAGGSYGLEVVVPHIATHGKYKGKHDGTFDRFESEEVKTFSKFNKLVNNFKEKYK